MSLRRSSALRLPSGAHLQTPLLVPSLSSHNVGRLINDKGELESVASWAVQWLAGQITETLLVSAFDLHHDRLHDAAALLSGAATLYHEPQLLMVDSGQYEARQRAGLDSADASDWSAEACAEVYCRLPRALDIAIVNFDCEGRALDEQVAQARQFLDGAGRDRLQVMLLKPEAGQEFVQPHRVSAVVAELRAFHIIGVTEKELGNTLLQRLKALAALRRALDAGGLQDRPIHVFGGLDPLLTPLYLMCGAEIFDGVGWLRYAYVEDMAVYQETRAVLALELDAKVPSRIMGSVTDNHNALRDMRLRLGNLVVDGDLKAYSDERGRTLDRVWQRVRREVGES